MGSINTMQIRQLHAVLAKLDLMAYKVDYLLEATDGRALSTKDLNVDEARILINKLNIEGDWLKLNTHAKPKVKENPNPAPSPLDKLRKKVISCFWQLNYTQWSEPKKKHVADMTRIQQQLKFSWGKELNFLNEKELQKIIAILEKEWIPFYFKKNSK